MYKEKEPFQVPSGLPQGRTCGDAKGDEQDERQGEAVHSEHQRQKRQRDGYRHVFWRLRVGHLQQVRRDRRQSAYKAALVELRLH